MGPKSQPSDLSQRKIVLFDVVCSEFVVAQKVIKRDIGQRGGPTQKAGVRDNSQWAPPIWPMRTKSKPFNPKPAIVPNPCVFLKDKVGVEALNKAR